MLRPTLCHAALQVGLAAASLALVGVFALTNGSSDLAYMLSPTPRGEPRTVRPGAGIFLCCYCLPARPGSSAGSCSGRASQPTRC